ncbi:MAG TPA: vWA domain-containing protein [Pyrinomonadaceae bacterium]
MKNKTDITVILDRSGSMESVKQDTIGGFNSFLSEQQSVEGEASLSLVQFDDQYEVVYEDQSIARADRLTERTFQPRGSTALFDAVGRTINAVGQRLAALAEAERPDKVLLVIMTDGYENASREFSAAQVSEMINHQRRVYSWEFMFIGANQDAVLSAGQIGIPAAASLTYAANSEGTEIAYSMIASKVKNYRVSNSAAALQFNEEDRERQKKAGAKK